MKKRIREPGFTDFLTELSRREQERQERTALRAKLDNCSIIYRPKGQAGEYAPLATNPYSGCGHRCRYCYVARLPFWTNANRKLTQARKEFDAGAVPRPNFLKLLIRDAKKYQAA